MQYICKKHGHCWDCPILNTSIEPCENMIEIAEVVHGHFINDVNSVLKCSICGKYIFLKNNILTINYCPNCGAKMDSIAKVENLK